jgi:outer membrane protein OmpA-like peptidoglycan-associated protein
MAMYAGAWSAPNTTDDNAGRNDYFGFTAGYQPTQDYFSPNVIYGIDIASSFVAEARLGYNSNTRRDDKNVFTRFSLYGRSSFSSNMSLLYGPFIQYEDETNPFQTGFSGVIKHQLDSDVALFGGVSAVVKKESSVRVIPELMLGITWAIPSLEPTRTIISEPNPTLPPEPERNTHKQVTEILPPQPVATLPPEKASVEATHVFKVNSSYITNEKVLKESIQYLHQHPDIRVRIINKHSKGGTLDYNHWLGQRRIERLRVFYTENGIDIQRLEITSSFKEQYKLVQPLVQISYFDFSEM